MRSATHLTLAFLALMSGCADGSSRVPTESFAAAKLQETLTARGGELLTIQQFAKLDGQRQAPFGIESYVLTFTATLRSPSPVLVRTDQLLGASPVARLLMVTDTVEGGMIRYGHVAPGQSEVFKGAPPLFPGDLLHVTGTATFALSENGWNLVELGQSGMPTIDSSNREPSVPVGHPTARDAQGLVGAWRSESGEICASIYVSASGRSNYYYAVIYRCGTSPSSGRWWNAHYEVSSWFGGGSIGGLRLTTGGTFLTPYFAHMTDGTLRLGMTGYTRIFATRSPNSEVLVDLNANMTFTRVND